MFRGASFIYGRFVREQFKKHGAKLGMHAQKKVISSVSVDSCLFKLGTYGWGDVESNTGMLCHGVNSEELFGVDPFFITKGFEERKLEASEELVEWISKLFCYYILEMFKEFHQT